MLGVVWAKFVSPLDGMLGAMSGAYIAALPVIPVFVASQTEFDLDRPGHQRDALAAPRGPLRARRRRGASGYVLVVEHAEIDLAGGARALELDLQGLWEEPEER